MCLFFAFVFYSAVSFIAFFCLTHIVCSTSNGKFHYIDHIWIDHFKYFSHGNESTKFIHTTLSWKTKLQHSFKYCCCFFFKSGLLFIHPENCLPSFNFIIDAKAKQKKKHTQNWRRRNKTITKSNRNDTQTLFHIQHCAIWIVWVCTVSIVSHRVSDNDASGSEIETAIKLAIIWDHFPHLHMHT